MSSYPYISGQAGVFATIAQLRKGFPTKVDAGYLKRFSLAKGNESYVISILRFLELLDDEGNRVEDKTDYFFGDDQTFEAGLEAALRRSYKQLFDEMGDAALTADRAALANWFRAADKTSELVGGRQATTFLALAALAGHGEVPSIAPAKKAASAAGTTRKAAPAAKKVAPAKGAETAKSPLVMQPVGSEVGVTVRIEVNLPPGGDAATYDSIFASIKKHLMS